jgi:hypothetical protein
MFHLQPVRQERLQTRARRRNPPDGPAFLTPPTDACIRQANNEVLPLAWLTRCRDRAAVPIHDPPADCETHPGAPVARSALQTLERHKDLVEEAFLNPDSVVVYGDRDELTVGGGIGGVVRIWTTGGTSARLNLSALQSRFRNSWRIWAASASITPSTSSTTFAPTRRSGPPDPPQRR